MKKLLVLFASFLALSVSAREFKDIIVNPQHAQINRVSNEDFNIELPRFVFSHTNTKINIRFHNPMHDKLVSNGYKLNFIVNGEDQLIQFDQDGVGSIACIFKADNKLNVLFEDASCSKELSVISIWYMILPLVGLFLFLGYKLAFGRSKLKVVSNEEMKSEQIPAFVTTANLKLVREEELA